MTLISSLNRIFFVLSASLRPCAKFKTLRLEKRSLNALETRAPLRRVSTISYPAGRLWDKIILVNSTKVSLLVIRTADMRAALAFYGALGLSFTEEQHGRRAVASRVRFRRFSFLEIYPARAGETGDSTMIGFARSHRSTKRWRICAP